MEQRQGEEFLPSACHYYRPRCPNADAKREKTGGLASGNSQKGRGVFRPFIDCRGQSMDHFKSGKPATLYDTTSPDWIPTLNLGHTELKEGDTSRHDRGSY